MRSTSASLRGLLSVLLVTGFVAGLGLPSMVSAGQKGEPLQANALDIVINEVAWAGTSADPADEWIELYNPESSAVPLDGWELTDGGDINIIFSSTDIIPGGSSGGYFLLESTDDTTISDIPANFIYSGQLANDNETLTLLDNNSNVIDTANSDTGAWPVLSGSPDFFSMERTCVLVDGEFAWLNNDGITRNGLDAISYPINGTPGQPNSTKDYCLIINEVAWAGTIASPDDEWIEIYNPSEKDIVLDDWRLVAVDSTPDINFPNVSLPVSEVIIEFGDYILLERREAATNVDSDLIYSGSLNDDGEILRLRAPNGTIVDTANSDGGNWPAGHSSTTASMERMGVIPDDPVSWVTFNNTTYIALDAAGNFIRGTPGGDNWGFSVTHTPTPTPAGALTVLINEVAWMGTVGSSSDEWIELYNPGSQPIDLINWRLYSSTDNNPNIIFSSTNCDPDCIIPAGGYFVIASNEAAFDDGVHAPLAPDSVILFLLNNEGEVLRLADPSNAIVDTANSDGGAWPAGVGSPTYATMERRGVQADGFFAWSTYSNPANSETPAPPPYPNPLVYDRNGNLIKGTPGQANWGPSVTQTPTFTATPPRTATPTRTPTKRPTATAYLSRLVLINEFLPRPGSDWNHDGLVNVYDEFIEIINADSVEINLKGWQLDDEEKSGSAVFTLPEMKLKPGQRAVYYGLQTNILLSDGGDTVRLVRPNGELADQQPYVFARYPDVSECQYPEGPGYFGIWRKECFPTPGTANQLTGDLPPAPEQANLNAPVCLLPDTLLEDFLLAECNGFGADMWNAWYWDKDGWGQGRNVLLKSSPWGAWVE